MGEGRRNAGRPANLNERTKLSKWKRKRKAGGGGCVFLFPTDKNAGPHFCIMKTWKVFEREKNYSGLAQGSRRLV